ncbi:STAS domain-containing protein [Streptomyces sp. NPDC019396]|uniref:STAS domain-containing protein n=1 Tax=Streptomyces sp. NPDC019396 TaxID=3154687 RepID=UPI0033EF9F98
MHLRGVRRAPVREPLAPSGSVGSSPQSVASPVRRVGSVMTTEPSVDATVSGMCLTVRIGGEMDWQTAPFFRNRLVDEIARGLRFVVLDLSAVSFCDSAGLNVLLGARRQTERAGSVLVLACVPPNMHRLLNMTGVDSVLRRYDTVTEAERAVGSGT